MREQCFNEGDTVFSCDTELFGRFSISSISRSDMVRA